MFGNFKPLSTLLDINDQSTSAGNRLDNGVRVEENGLYMVLWDTGITGKYHWGLLVAQTNTSGVLCHQALSGPNWKFIVEIKDLSVSKSVLLALKVGYLEKTNDEWLSAMKSIIRNATVHGELTCRTWALAALYELASAGFIDLDPNWDHVHGIEEEAKRLAEHARFTDTKFVQPSQSAKLQ
ncbi:hypothetical protein RJZ56_003839 [Blastomyces dermatitidis]|uniref:Uncharacterized protein n=3 Tax=Blastomyces TaxID=229219 RepID=A0A179UBA4_BLAGS|nr:uncharacterized protein BDBG_01723 [Blastomyces gilchristii SLH14081]XP_045275784.1 uncharacterized protein BDCG_03833 [Blastomyces dermatitidis ER-3]EEQ88713.1 hypothetical protein BDCG_03833 [Blastomyces dermatitidis ER-3]EQL38835.1 hypothetical protein BDFG_00361 [Blastomyces dermatitidis ATCC 26199]OAT05305.1 hypothetical protein BDBG_01723 [Blastomyces gilchristii SLH14081]